MHRRKPLHSFLGAGQLPMVMAMALSARVLVLLLLVPLLGMAEPTTDRAALLDFISNTPHEGRVRWDPAVSACAWEGVACDHNSTAVVELRLPGVGLAGPIPPNTLGRLVSLRVLSLRSNFLSGELPSDLSNLSLLRHLYLQNNAISGPIPSWLSSLGRLVRIDLSGNNLTGGIPFDINNLTKLTGLFLQRNRLSGSLPSISTPLDAFNVSYNELNGSVPKSLQRFPASSFAGNLELCGGPLPPCAPFFPSPASSPHSPENPARKSSGKLSAVEIVAIAVGCGAAMLILLLVLMLLCLRRRKGGKRVHAGKKGAKKGSTAIGAANTGRSGELTGTVTSSSSKDISVGICGTAGERSRLAFIGDANNSGGGGYSFDLEDLLRASAEVMGKGMTGTSYKAVLEEGSTVVVKRLKEIAAGRRDFEAHAEALGRVPPHPNVVPPRAYYFSNDEKLLVHDYFPAGNLSALLHGRRGSGRAPLDWDNRLRIAVAAGRGLAHLHASLVRTAHGNVKASNVLLRPDPLSPAAVSDYGIAPLLAPGVAPSSLVDGYRAPEIHDPRRPTFKSDVYSFGVLLLELLTGRAPNQAAIAGNEGEGGVDLPRWVQSVVREEWTAEVFDAELAQGTQTTSAGAEEEMVALLQIAMACVAPVPDARPDIGDVVRMMEDIMARSEAGELTMASSEEPSKGDSGGPPRPTAPPTVTQ